MYALGGGIRSNYGLLRGAIAASSGVDYAGVSFVLAAAQLAFGIMQPVFGAAALCRGLLALLLCFGILMPAGLGAFSFGLIMGAVTPLLGEKRAAAVSGVINASSGLGSILLALVLRGTLDGFGLWGGHYRLVPAAGVSGPDPSAAAKGRRPAIGKQASPAAAIAEIGLP